MAIRFFFITLFASLLLPNQHLNASTYYFSSSIGDDTRNASVATKENSPWQSIEKLNAIISSLSPGDSVLFKKGDTFHGSITIRKSGTVDKPIFFGSYGEGDKPIIKATKNVSIWEKFEKGIYKSSVTAKIVPQLQIVLINGKIQAIGRFPNNDQKENGYLRIQSDTKKNNLKNHLLNGPLNWKGGEVVIRKNHWIIDREKIIDHSSDNISFIPSSGYEIRANFGFFIQNHIGTLDQFGEWFYNQKTEELFMFFGEKNPEDYRIELATQDDIVTTMTNTRNIIFSDLILEGANRHGFFLLGGDNFTILNCVVRNSGQDGVHAINNSNLHIIDTEIQESLNSGLNLKSGNQNCLLENNTISNTYLIPGMGQNGDNNGFGIYSISNNDTIKRNKILNSGYVGIGFKGNGTLVAENFIERFCMTKNDGSGIYTYTGSSNIEFKSREIRNNIIISGIGNLSGTNLTPGLHTPQVEGIYIDDNASEVKISGNTIAHIPNFGINIHNARNIEIRKNLIFDTGHSVHIGNDERGKDVSGITIVANKFITRTPSQFTLGIYDKINRISILGEINGNFHYSPFGNDQLVQIRTKDYQGQKAAISANKMDLQKWGIESESVFLIGNSKFYETIKYLGPDLIGAVKINGIPANILCTSGCDIEFAINKLFDRGHLYVLHKNDQSTIKIDIGGLKSNALYELKITAKAHTEVDTYIFLRHRKDPYTAISHVKKIRIGDSTKTYHVILDSYIDTSESSIILNQLAKESNFGIESISLRQIDVSLIDKNDLFQFEYNFSNLPLSTTINKPGITNESSAGNIGLEIPPFSGAVFSTAFDFAID